MMVPLHTELRASGAQLALLPHVLWRLRCGHDASVSQRDVGVKPPPPAEALVPLLEVPLGCRVVTRGRGVVGARLSNSAWLGC